MWDSTLTEGLCAFTAAHCVRLISKPGNCHNVCFSHERGLRLVPGIGERAHTQKVPQLVPQVAPITLSLTLSKMKENVLPLVLL